MVQSSHFLEDERVKPKTMSRMSEFELSRNGKFLQPAHLLQSVFLRHHQAITILAREIENSSQYGCWRSTCGWFLSRLSD